MGKNYKESKPRLEDLRIGTGEIKVSLSVEDDPSYNHKIDELQRVKKFLKDSRFRIDLESRKGGQFSTIVMQGK